MTEEDINTLHKEWQEEKDRLIIELSNTNVSTKFIYDRISQLLKFSEMLPKLFLKATTEEKKHYKMLREPTKITIETHNLEPLKTHLY